MNNHDPIATCRCPYCRPKLRGIDSGCIWPLGRSHASDLAQVRQCERDLAALPQEAAQCA